jgi:pimeloyl-ACP methyl ester carboxylesterase
MTKTRRISRDAGAAVVACVAFLLCMTAQRAQADEAEVKEQKTMKIKPTSTGFLKVNGIELWHEIYGEGQPLVLLHGGLMTIPEMAPLIEPLAKHRRVIALELQGHGRSPDTDRPLALKTCGDDVGAVIDALGLKQADVAGYSFGAEVALRAAIQHPNKVRRLIVISTPFAKRGWYRKAQEGMATVNASLAAAMKDTPAGQFAQRWPKPERFGQFLDKMGEMLVEDYDWKREVEALRMPVMLIYADHDSVSTAHIAEFFALLGGGISEPGWEKTQFTNARLAIIPGYSHYDFMTSTEIPPLMEKFLAAPKIVMTCAPSVAAAAATSKDKR